MFLLAQAGGVSIVQWILIAIALAAVVAIMMAAFKHFGIQVPPLFLTVLWIVVGAVICILAVKFVWGLIFGAVLWPLTCIDPEGDDEDDEDTDEDE